MSLEIFRHERASQNKPLKMQYAHKREETNNNKEYKEIIITKKINKNKNIRRRRKKKLPQNNKAFSCLIDGSFALTGYWSR
jgi:hypothetical protein